MDKVAELELTNAYDQFLRDFAVDVDLHALVSHLQWTVWAIVQKNVSVIDFDYVAYAKLRWEGYEWLKAKTVAKSS